MAELTVAGTDVLVVAGLFAAFLVILIFTYRFSNKRLMEKIRELKRKDAELNKLIEKVNNARVAENRGMHKRLQSLEERVDILLKPESDERVLEREKIIARSRG